MEISSRLANDFSVRVSQLPFEKLVSLTPLSWVFYSGEDISPLRGEWGDRQRPHCLSLSLSFGGKTMPQTRKRTIMKDLWSTSLEEQVIIYFKTWTEEETPSSSSSFVFCFLSFSHSRFCLSFIPHFLLSEELQRIWEDPRTSHCISEERTTNKTPKWQSELEERKKQKPNARTEERTVGKLFDLVFSHVRPVGCFVTIFFFFL